MKRTIAALMCATLALPLTGCEEAGIYDGAGTIVRVPEQDGRALFIAIYSGLGDENLKVPPQTPPESQKEIDREKALSGWNRIADKVQEQQPSFFAEFSISLRSGDPYLVKAALTRGSEAAGKAVPLALSGAVVAEPQAVEKCTVGVWACVTLAVAFHTAAGAFNYIGGINIALAVNTWVWRYTKWWDSTSSLQTERQTEAFVKDLTEGLKG